MSKRTVELICRALLAIVAALSQEYGLPRYNHVSIRIEDDVAGAVEYDTMTQGKKE